MATAGIIILLAAMCLVCFILGGAFAVSNARKGSYRNIGIGPMPRDAVGVCEVIDCLPRQEQLNVTLAGLITLTDQEEDEMARAVTDRFAAHVERFRNAGDPSWDKPCQPPTLGPTHKEP